MIDAIVIVCYWYFGGLLTHRLWVRLIQGFPAPRAVEVLALVVGVLVAICSRLLIVSLHFGLIATVATYFVGMVNSGTTAALVNPGPTNSILMRFDQMYYKREVLSIVPRVVYVVASVILFCVW